MKLKLLTVFGIARLILPGIAPAQNAVTEWNNIAVATALVGNSVIPANSPNGTALYLAYVHLAIHDAVNAIEHKYKPFGPAFTAPAGASVPAAVASAAYNTLKVHFPNQAAALTVQYDAAIAALPDNGKMDGVAAGMTAANQILSERAGDGHGANIAYSYPAAPTPGVWIPTPPAFAPPITPWMSQMVPFTMRS